MILRRVLECLHLCLSPRHSVGLFSRIVLLSSAFFSSSEKALINLSVQPEKSWRHARTCTEHVHHDVQFNPIQRLHILRAQNFPAILTARVWHSHKEVRWKWEEGMTESWGSSKNRWRVGVKQDKSDVHGRPPNSAATWTGLSDFITRDGALSVSEKGFSPFNVFPLISLKSTTLKVLFKSKQQVDSRPDKGSFARTFNRIRRL